MSDQRNEQLAGNEHSLDPDEKWGQGTDLSHPESGTGQPIEDQDEPGDEFGTEERGPQPVT